MSDIEQLKFNADGLIPAIIQEQGSGRVLMLAWMNLESLRQTLAVGKTVFWSRSRQKFWMKGETSGHTQTVKSIAFDCDADALLIQVEQIGPACHEGYRSCFYRTIDADGRTVRMEEERMATPDQIYGKK
jgi:phosphoribosyl-AMP cyclohydrolase